MQDILAAKARIIDDWPMAPMPRIVMVAVPVAVNRAHYRSWTTIAIVAFHDGRSVQGGSDQGCC